MTTRDIESDEAFGKVESLPLVAGVASVGRLLLPFSANTLEDLKPVKPAPAKETDAYYRVRFDRPGRQ